MAEAVNYKMMDSSAISDQEIALLRDQIWRMRHPQAQGRDKLWSDNIVPKVMDLKPPNDDSAPIATQRIFEWESDTTWFRAYEVEVHKFTGFQYVLDFTGTTNHEIQGTFGVTNMRVEANLQPFELETVCLISRNKLDPFKFSVKMQWITSDVHPAILETALAMNANRIRNEYDSLAQAGIKSEDEDDKKRVKLKKYKLRYVDEDFYPCPQSLYVDGDKAIDKIAEEQVMWRRAADFCANPAVFKDGINPSDVQQGRLGNCWFLCSLASMAERPNLITSLFTTEDFNEEGMYQIRFCHNGLWKTITLDDYIPCKPYTGPIYTKTADDELWVALLEKAYAKIYGCYERLVAGSPYHALPDLTGCPAEIYELHDKDQMEGFWEKLLDWNKTENNLMSAACDETSTKNPVEAGLLYDHAYTILDAKQGLQPLVRLVQIRNPWGHGEWKGDWSDYSPLWTEKAKKAFNNPNPVNDDGTFWMSFEDFLQYFTTFNVCYCRRDWQEARIGCDLSWDHDNKKLVSPVQRLIVPDGGVCEWLGMFQQDDREQGAPTYLDLSLFVFKETNNGREYIGHIGMENSRQAFAQFDKEARENKTPLTGGSYLLIPFTSGRHWDVNSGQSRAISISAHVHSTGNKPSIRTVAAYSKDEIDEAILQAAMQKGEQKLWHDLERRHLRVGQMDIYVGKNHCQNKILIYSMEGELENIQNAFGYPDLAEGEAFELSPNEEKIFGVQVMKDPKEPGSSAYKFGLKHKAV